MSERRVLILFGLFLAIVSGPAVAHAQGSAESFSITASNVTMPTSGAGSIPFTLTSVNGFAGTVAVGCSPANPPTGAILPQCNYTGGAVAAPPYTLTANGTVTGSLNLVAYIPPCSNPCPVKLMRRHRPWGAGTLGLAGVLLLGLGAGRRRACWLRLIVLAFGSLAGLAGMSACGAGSTLTPGTYAYTITGLQTGTTGPYLTANTTVNVLVPASIATNLGSANP